MSRTITRVLKGPSQMILLPLELQLLVVENVEAVDIARLEQVPFRAVDQPYCDTYAPPRSASLSVISFKIQLQSSGEMSCTTTVFGTRSSGRALDISRHTNSSKKPQLQLCGSAKRTVRQ